MDSTDVLKDEEENLPFTNSGECSDEIVLKFDGGQKLFVSENFLSYASPVFKAMFQHDFKEKETKEVAMKEKEHDDFQEFLLCLHPGVQKPIDQDNVLRVVSFAEEYQVAVSVERCQNVMRKWLSTEVENAVKVKNNQKRARHAVVCLTIFSKSGALGFEELTSHCIQEIARFGHEIFTGSLNVIFGTQAFVTPATTVQWQPAPVRISSPVLLHGGQPPNTGYVFGSSQPTSIPLGESIKTKKEDKKDQLIFGNPGSPNEECKELFDSLPEVLKIRLLLQRLKLSDNGEMR